MSTKIITNAQNPIYFHAAYTGVFFGYTYQTLCSARFFPTAILLVSHQFTVKKALLVEK